MHYKIVECDKDLSDLECEVQTLISHGWEPIGGPATVQYPGLLTPVTTYFQAMIKRAE